MVQPFMDEVTRRTRGAIRFERFPAQQLGKAADLLSLTQSGVVDVGYMVPSYVAGNKMPHSEVAHLPNAYSSSCEGTTAYWKLAREGSLQKFDFAPNKIRLLLATLTAPYIVLTKERPIKSLQDFKGMKLRSSGAAMDLSARALNAIPTNIAGPDIYDAVARGTVDGAFFAVESISAYSITDVSKYSTDGVGFGATALTWVMRVDLWNSLSPEVRQIMDEVATEQVMSGCKKMEAYAIQAKEDAQKKGLTFVPFSAEAKSEIEGVLDKNVGKLWADELDRRGKKGSQVLREFQQLVSEQK
jgi:TRAP-type C4-dicarboxylate transport system substrate-binding protein